MPDFAPLPPNPSLEQLRKQAKERLKDRRAAGRADTLADVQAELAREYGFRHWAELAHHVATVNPPGLRKFEQMAAELAAAYAAGDYHAVREFNWTYGTSFVWDRDPEAMQRHLPNWQASPSRPMDLAIADARALIARKMGLDTWATLVRSLGQGAPVSLCRVRPDLSLSVDGGAADGHWDVVLAVIAERRISHVSVRGLTDRGLKELARASRITRLEIGGAQLTDDGMRHLAGMPQLEALDFGGPQCRISDRGLVHLQHLRELRRVALSWAPLVSDAGIANLRACDRLEHVDLMGTRTGDGALAALAGKSALSYLATGTSVTDAGLARLQDFPVFRTRFAGQARYDLMSFSVTPNHLLLDGPFTDRGLRALAGLDGLVGVNLFWHTPAFTSAGLAVFAELPSLVFLGCDGKRCDDDALRQIARIPTLRMLMAQGTVASDEGFAALSDSATLEYLWGRECPNLTGRGFASLANARALRGLAVSCAGVDDAALATLPTFPALTDFVSMDVHDAGFRHVGRCHRLQRLWCMYCRDTTDAATAHLTDLTDLRSYYAGATRITDRSLELLSRLHTLERVELSDIAGVTDAGLGALSTLPRLRELNVDGSPRITSDGIAGFPARVRVSFNP